MRITEAGRRRARSSISPRGEATKNARRRLSTPWDTKIPGHRDHALDQADRGGRALSRRLPPHPGLPAAGAHAAPTGTLTVSAPVRFGRLCVLPVPMAFLERHPKLDGRTPFVDRTATLIGEGIDLAVRIGHLPDPGYVARTVGAIRREVSAAPGFLRRHGFRRRRAACRAIASSI
ncbi:hypothetical protein GIY62_26120 [Burkholderia plantarii]|uniref:LysR substrate-binding domain-containing protein n=1 Tax=Burkholderia plantarii TaxID=41899 RepID=UPI00272CDFD3|nr:LysR substrate-binding domain-containing protein [Burkholderia plantarii]WLE63742.1 hypothetical protein GIY62_26120 [Burkholderia plantarii]